MNNTGRGFSIIISPTTSPRLITLRAEKPHIYITDFYSALKDWECTEEGILHKDICSMHIDEVRGFVLLLHNAWISSECEIYGGAIVSIDNQGIEIPSSKKREIVNAQ